MIDEAVAKRTRKSNSILYYSLTETMLGKKKIDRKAKLHVFKAIIMPSLTYASEAWIRRTKHNSKITAAEMKIFRWRAGKMKLNRIRNVNIRKLLDVEPIVNVIERKQLKWYGHVIRMNDKSLPKVMGSSKVGNICKDKTLNEKKQITLDRKL